MKIKLFLSGSLAALGLWLAAAYLHTVDMASYQPNTPQAAQLNAPVETELESPEITGAETAALAQ